ncbi:MAG: hypothetical protein QXW97_01880 [Candidatus Pacearchaeota archaeon]
MRKKIKKQDFTKRNKKFENNKRAETEPLGSNVVNFVIGLIALIILIGVGVMVYKLISVNSSDVKTAEVVVEKIRNIMEEAKRNPGQDFFYDVEGPGNKWWWIIAWPYQNRIEKPIKCNLYRKSWCICICERPSNLRVAWNLITSNLMIRSITTSLQKCNNNGRCLEVENPVKTINQGYNMPIPIESPPIQISIKYIDSDKGYEITFVK